MVVAAADTKTRLEETADQEPEDQAYQKPVEQAPQTKVTQAAPEVQEHSREAAPVAAAPVLSVATARHQMSEETADQEFRHQLPVHRSLEPVAAVAGPLVAALLEQVRPEAETVQQPAQHLAATVTQILAEAAAAQAMAAQQARAETVDQVL
jgi:non-ribosomal peptide synthetase component F